MPTQDPIAHERTSLLPGAHSIDGADGAMTTSYMSVPPVKPLSSSSNKNGKRSKAAKHIGTTTTEKIFQNDKKLAEKIQEESPKLDTYSGVFLPTALNVLSILMFLRFGFIVGQLGIIGSLFTLGLCYTINLLTTLSVSAIATNGVVRTGGAYYMISRSLGPEFGGAIGLIFYFGQILNAALNVVGLIEPLVNNFGAANGSMWPVLPDGYTWNIIYSTVILFLCVAISLVGSDMVSRAALLLFILLMTSILSVPISAIFMPSFNVPGFDDVWYSGISWHTFTENLLPHFTSHAAGSQLDTKETFADLFGIFFSATAGILAGASMSGSLKNPSRSIPKGTLWGLLLTFFCYALIIISLGVSVPRKLLYSDVQVIQTVNLSQVIIVVGEVSTSLFSVIMGVVGAAEILAAISKDSIIPGLSIFAAKNSNPINAIIVSWLLIQAFLFANINQIATLITMAFLMTFIVIHIACFLLEVSAAPNFRPSFDYFNRTTAASGVISCFIAMFIVDGISASMIIMCLLFLIILIHYVCPPKSWGDVSQTLIYHQVRKYLLKLRQDNVKYWRPQILLLVDNPRTCWNLMHFCNNLKKGGLYILGHVIVSSNNFEENYDNYVSEKNAWVKLRDSLQLKAFVQFSYAASLPWGIRNVFLGSGLGSMKPNIIVIGFVDLSNRKVINTNLQPDPIKAEPTLVPRNIEKLNAAYTNQGNVSAFKLPTDAVKRDEKRIKITEWVQCIEELLLMKANVAVAKGFPRLEIPDKKAPELDHDEKQIIDLYPIQMSAEIAEKSGKTILSTNFDTYTLILQLGAILITVPQWERTHRLRIVVFVENLEDVDDERSRVTQLLGVLRINAEVLVLCFNSSSYSFYDYIMKNKYTDKRVVKKVNKVLQSNEWWKAITELRIEQQQQQQQQQQKTTHFQDILFSPSFGNPQTLEHNLAINKNNNIPLSKLQRLGVNFRMRTNKLLSAHVGEGNPVFRDEDSSSDSDDGYSDTESAIGYDSDPEPSIRRSSLKYSQDHVPTLASERRKRRKTFSSLIIVPPKTRLRDSQAVPKTPKSPFLESTGPSISVPAISLEDSTELEGEPMKRPVLSRQSSRHSYTSLRSQARPNFTSQTLPKSKVNEDADGNEPSIIFTNDGDDASLKSKSSGMRLASAQKRVPSKVFDKERLTKKENDTVNYAGVSDHESTFSCPSDAEEVYDDTRQNKSVLERISSYPSESSEDSGEESDDHDIISSDSTSNLEEFDINNLTFNDVPARAQHLILNQLMMKCSKNSSIIFTTLPTPPAGCHKNKKDAVEYVETLDLWCSGLPPIFLINSRTMTVTTAL
ncbi:Vhc1 protein [Saccharomycopsis crataegensis]|uniref:Vhc1 protein n=1 Tax=Saccharomycopsis crataegensis TaxID=43959 RepID=A0AAV5QKZ2_9ASCO|nr:Vhc1 protein [Saccharomycopsis crataegensis]